MTIEEARHRAQTVYATVIDLRRFIAQSKLKPHPRIILKHAPPWMHEHAPVISRMTKAQIEFQK